MAALSVSCAWAVIGAAIMPGSDSRHTGPRHNGLITGADNGVEGSWLIALEDGGVPAIMHGSRDVPDDGAEPMAPAETVACRPGDRRC